MPDSGAATGRLSSILILEPHICSVAGAARRRKKHRAAGLALLAGQDMLAATAVVQSRNDYPLAS
jgi:hypothetical protein